MIESYNSLCTLFYDLDKPFSPANEYLFYLSYCEKYQTDKSLCVEVAVTLYHF